MVRLLFEFTDSRMAERPRQGEGSRSKGKLPSPYTSTNGDPKGYPDLLQMYNRDSTLCKVLYPPHRGPERGGGQTQKKCVTFFEKAFHGRS